MARKRREGTFVLDGETMVELIRKGLKCGIPPTALANMFDLNPDITRELAVTMRRERYGTAELSEAMSFMTWVAYEEMLRMLKNGATDARLKAIQGIMGKALATSVRQTPEEVARAREEFLRLEARYDLIELEEGDIVDVEPSAFAAVDGDVDDQG